MHANYQCYLQLQIHSYNEFPTKYLSEYDQHSSAQKNIFYFLFHILYSRRKSLWSCFNVIDAFSSLMFQP